MNKRQRRRETVTIFTMNFLTPPLTLFSIKDCDHLRICQRGKGIASHCFNFNFETSEKKDSPFSEEYQQGDGEYLRSGAQVSS